MLRSNVDSLINSIYGGLTPLTGTPPPDYFLHRTILSARNEDVEDINQRVLDRMLGDEYIFHSTDTI
ncbi:hypothetical protein C8Q80DRAFT_1100779, partial [Daedaleopsis nitida]